MNASARGLPSDTGRNMPTVSTKARSLTLVRVQLYRNKLIKDKLIDGPQSTQLMRACLNLFRPGWNGWNGTRLRTRGRSFHSMLFVSILNFQATEQPTRKENNPTDFCGGTAQLDPKTGVPSRGQRVLLTQRMTLHANIPQGKPQSNGASHPSRTFGKRLEVMISPSRLYDDS